MRNKLTPLPRDLHIVSKASEKTNRLSEVMADRTPTYEATLAHHGIKPGQMQRQCSDEMVSVLAPKMNSWRAIILGVEKGKVDAIENDATDEEGKRRKYLECWKQKLGHKATCERLARNFIQSGRADLADAVCEEIHASTDGISA